MVTTKKWLCFAAVVFGSFAFRAEAAQPMFLEDGFGHPIAATQNAGQWYLDVSASLNEVATAAPNAVGLPSLLKIIGGWDGTNDRAIKTDSSGRLYSLLTDSSGNAINLGQALMASSLPVTIASNQSALPFIASGGLSASGSISSTGTVFSQDCAQYQSVSVQVTSIGSGNTINFQVSNDNTNWFNAAMMPAGDLTGILTTTVVGVGGYTTQLNSRYFRVQVGTYGSGTITANAYFKTFGNAPNSVGGYMSAQTLDGVGNSISSTSNALWVAQQGALPAGTNVIGKFGIDQTTPGTTDRVYSNLDQVNSNAVNTGTGASGTGTQRVAVANDSQIKVWDGTNTQAVKAASTAAAATDPSAVVALSPNSALPAGSNVIGALSANQSVNLAQVAGSATNTGHGTAAGSIRVELPTDGTGVVGLNAGSNIVGKVGIDQTTPGTTNRVASNLDQIAGTSILTGTGASGAGSQRVAVSNDSKVQTWDGSNTITVKAASTAPVATDTALVVVSSPNQAALPTKQPVNANATLSARQTVSTSESNLAAPANAVCVIFEAESGNLDNLRWGFSNSTTAILSSTLGVLMEPGRSVGDGSCTPIGAGTYLHMIATGSAGTDYMDVQWILSQ